MSEVNSITNATVGAKNRGGLVAHLWQNWQGMQLGQLRWDKVAFQKRLFLAAELLVVVLWALIITSPYLDMEPSVVPAGREYLSAIQTHHLWTQARACGLCALWNGNVRGGAPAFVDLHGSMLHPLVILTTLAWGVINGSKIALVGSFIMSGLAQWWLARVLRLGQVARLWSACMAVAAGHLSARMELGAFGVVLSTAACALILPPLITLSQTASRRAAVQLGVTLALAALAGQGYMQVGLLLTMPAIILLVPWEEKYLSLLGRRFALAAVLAFLLAALFLVPFLHFLPQFVKETDANFKVAQPFSYIPLNLVINDQDFLTTKSLHKTPYPHLNANYVGWIPLLLAMLAFSGQRNQAERRVVIFLAAQALLAIWVSSAIPLSWLVRFAPFQSISDLIAGIRHPPQIAGLAIPAILALAGIGLDRLLQQRWTQLQLILDHAKKATPSLSLSLRWLLLFPLLFALNDARSFAQKWIYTEQLSPRVPEVLEGLRTPDLQWVNAPFGEHFYTESAMGMGLKLASGIRTWNWKDRPFPKPVLEANHLGPPPAMTQETVMGGVPIYVAPPSREYATVVHFDTSTTVCTAQGIGGDIEVNCDAPQAGILTIKENSWSGWRAEVDGEAVELEASQWLAVEIPAGKHTIEFRYRPWDVPLGILLSLIGITLALYHWFQGDQEPFLALPQLNHRNNTELVNHNS